MAGLVMRLSRVLAEGDDRLERQAVGAVAAQRDSSCRATCCSRHADGEQVEHVLEGLVGHVLGAPEQLELLVVLDPADALDLVAARDELDVGQRRRQPAVASGR